MRSKLSSAVRATRCSTRQLRPALATPIALLPIVGGAGSVHSSTARFCATMPAIERVAYALVGSEWRRATQPMLDGTALNAGDRLLGEVAAVAVRYRDDTGNWSESWNSEPGDRLPRAVEVRVSRSGREALTMLFLTAPTLPPPPAQEVPAP